MYTNKKNINNTQGIKYSIFSWQISHGDYVYYFPNGIDLYGGQVCGGSVTLTMLYEYWLSSTHLATTVTTVTSVTPTHTVFQQTF